MWFLVAHNRGWLCVSLSVQSAKGGSHFLSTYCRYVEYHNAVFVYLAGPFIRTLSSLIRTLWRLGYHVLAQEDLGKGQLLQFYSICE